MLGIGREKAQRSEATLSQENGVLKLEPENSELLRVVKNQLTLEDNIYKRKFPETFRKYVVLNHIYTVYFKF